MRKWLIGAVLALALPAAALAEGSTPSATSLAQSACKAEKAQVGTKTFKKTYAAKSVAKATTACVAKRGVAATTDLKNAAKECKAERDAGADAFRQKYGTNKNGRNAYGKCVSSKAKAATRADTEARVDAAAECKKLSADELKTQFGAKRNAFGKCVSSKAKAAEQQQS